MNPFYYVCLMFVTLSCLVVTCWERANLLAFLYVKTFLVAHLCILKVAQLYLFLGIFCILFYYRSTTWDWVGIFPTDWHYLGEYVAYSWVPKGTDVTNPRRRGLVIPAKSHKVCI